MSVIIKDMEMPGSCGKCKMHFIGHPNYVCCGITNRIPKIVDSFRDSKTDLDARMKSIEAVKRPYWCPLVEIQTPHGRLIDINDVISVKSPTAREREKNEAIALCRAGRGAAIEAIVENAQIIIEAEGNNDEWAV